MIASVLQRLDKAKVRAVGLDIILDRPTEAALDEALAGVMSQVSYPIILGEDPGAVARDQICDETQPSPGRSSSILPQFIANASLAHIVICIDPLDDVVRFAPHGMGSEFQSFAEALHVASGGELPSNLGLHPIRFKPALKDNASQTYKAWPFLTYSASQIDLLPDELLRGKTVLIGQISPYSGDFFSTPLRFYESEQWVEPKSLMPRSELPGVVIHAFSLSDLRTGETGQTYHSSSQIPYVIFGALLGIFIVWRRWSLSVTVTAILGALTFYSWLIFAGFNWSGGLWLAPYCGLVLALLMSSGSTFALLEREERARRRWVQNGFAHFLSEERVQQLIDSPELLSLSAEEREVSILFTDLEGFTTLVDTVPPEQLTPILNGYLDAIMEVVVRYDGTVDKIIGDAVHAMFSAPLLIPKHRLQATLCALDILEATRAYQAKITEQGINLGRTRIGISSGNALVGNFGSSKRLDYTSHGSVVNLAARLESENKVFGTSICVSSGVKIQSDEIVYREIGTVSVRGLLEPVQVFEPLKAEEHSVSELEAYIEAFTAMNDDPERAIRLFESLASVRPSDGLVQYQLKKVQEILKSRN